MSYILDEAMFFWKMAKKTSKSQQQELWTPAQLWERVYDMQSQRVQHCQTSNPQSQKDCPSWYKFVTLQKFHKNINIINLRLRSLSFLNAKLPSIKWK
jgi:phosphorylcholine metabolism protein LicD